MVLIVATPAHAAAETRYVATTGDNDANDCTDMSNPCLSIQYGVDQADAGDTISVASGQYAEAVEIRKSLTIVGSGPGATTVSGDASDPNVTVDGTDAVVEPVVALTHLDLSGNSAAPGLYVTVGEAHLTDVVTSDDAGGINTSDSTVTATRSVIDANNGTGVLAMDSTVTLGYSEVANNKQGIVDEGGASFQISASTIYHNSEVGVGLLSPGPNLISNTTISGTTSAGGPSGAVVTIDAGAVQLVGTIIADNQTPDCSGTITDLGFNLDTDGTCGLSAAAHSHSNALAHLGAFGHNGGPTQTLLPGLSSAARNQIPAGKANCKKGAIDQRGITRPQPAGGKCDIGAVEVQVVNPRIHARIRSSHRKVHGVHRGAVTVSFRCRRGSAPLVHHCPKPVHLRKNGRHHVTKTIHAKDGGKASVSVLVRIHKPRAH